MRQWEKTTNVGHSRLLYKTISTKNIINLAEVTTTVEVGSPYLVLTQNNTTFIKKKKKKLTQKMNVCLQNRSMMLWFVFLKHPQG